MALDFYLASALEQWGFYDFILPFVLIFTIVFAVLQKVKIFGTADEARKFNIVIALVLGLTVVIPHTLGIYPPGMDVVAIMLESIPNVSLVLVAILMALLIIGLLGKRFEIGGGALSGWIALGAFAIVVYIFGSAARWWDLPFFRGFMANPDMIALIVTILVFAIIVWFVTSEPKDKDDENTFGKQMDRMLKGNN